MPGNEQAEISHYDDAEPVLDIFTNVENADLGSVTRGIQKIVDENRKNLPRGSHFILRGQSETMRNQSYIGLSRAASHSPFCSSTY